MILGGGQTAGEAGIVKLKTHLAGSQATDVSVAPSNGATSKEMDEMGAPKGRMQNLWYLHTNNGPWQIDAVPDSLTSVIFWPFVADNGDADGGSSKQHNNQSFPSQSGKQQVTAISFIST